jgi:hypothetical protein
MTDETYYVKRVGVDKEEDKKKKSVAFKAGTSFTKGKSKAKKEE